METLATEQMNQTKDLTIQNTPGELVINQPKWATVLDGLNIDFCDRQTSFAKVCAEKNLDAQTLLNTLCVMEGQLFIDEDKRCNWNKSSLTELVDNIEQTHHIYLKEKLPILMDLVSHVVDHHGDHYPWLSQFKDTCALFKEGMLKHNADEESGVFALIKKIETDSLDSSDNQQLTKLSESIDILMQQHQGGCGAFKKLRQISNNLTPPEGACGSFQFMLKAVKEIEHDTCWHIYKEDFILFPRGLKLAQSYHAT